MNPKTSTDFDRAYRAPLTVWGDIRVPPEIAALIRSEKPRRVLELGCGVGRFSRYVAKAGPHATGVDFSAVAIAKARAAVANDARRPEFLVGDVTDLKELVDPFDVAFDVGCFHCLDENQRARYVSEVSRLLVPNGLLLIWALDGAPSDLPFTPEAVARTFSPRFVLRDSRPSRRRFARSHWYWLERSPAASA